VARIPQNEIDRLRREVSVERLAEAHGVKLRRDHDKRFGVCPFHGDAEQPLVIVPKKNTWSCESCGDGTGIEWVMKANGVSFRHAAELLMKDHPALLTGAERTTAPPNKTTTTKLPTLFERDATDDDLVTRVVNFYHSTLTESPEALGYLASRGLNSAEMVERFKLGFANRTLAYRLPEKHRREGEQLRGRLQKLGILRESGHEHFNGSIIIPTFDAANTRVVSLYGRKITARLRDGTPLHLNAPDPPRGVWNELALTGGQVVLTQSLIDALTFWCAGVRNVTAVSGIGELPDDHGQAFERYAVKRAYIAFRRSNVADRAAETLATALNGIGIETFRVIFPKGMDANEYAAAGKSLEEAVRRAEWTGKGTVSVTVPEAICDRAAVATVDPIVMEPTTASTSTPTPMVATSTDEMLFTFGDRRWRVRGFERSTSHGDLRVNILVSRERAGFHIDILDLYAAKQRTTFVKQAAIELGLDDGTVKKELGAVLLELEARVDEQIRAKLAPTEKKPLMTDPEQEEALGLLRDPKLIERIVSDFELCGLVGEDTNKLLGYVAAVSRKLDEPLAVVVQSSSAAGKSSLMDAVLAFVPPEERVSFSAMTGQSLYYMGERDLRHKVLAIAEGEGADRASYPLKLLQSEGHLTIASTGKDAITGKLVAHEYTVTGPVATFLTTTAIDLDDELMNRCIVLSVDEGRDQTRRVHAVQRTAQTLSGILARRDRDKLVRLHRNAQRLLRTIVVVNPFAESLSFTDGRTRARRDHMKLLTLVRAIALLHQHQREPKLVEHEGERFEYIEVVAADIELATKLLADVLVRPDDELPPVTRNVLAMIESFVAEGATTANIPANEVRFTQRQIRERLGLGHTRLKMHLRRLEEQEYVVVHRGGRGQVRVYGLAGGDWSPGGRPPLAPWSPSGGAREGSRDSTGSSPFQEVGAPSGEHVNGAPSKSASYRT
jgi:DNA primase